ncbi:MAG: hypothetical protein NZ853_06365 [Leptospiraceae bacterium]|nr:hypothetical protein [Leptospiraceae bacterium]MDW7976425.1 hypothetical protein [Leptospiraceae bacterium]
MTRKIHLQKKIIILCFSLLNNLSMAQTKSAQEYLDMLDQTLEPMNGYYNGMFSFYFPMKHKENYDFELIKKNHHYFWNLSKDQNFHFRFLCDRKSQKLYFYDKRRDVYKKFEQKQLLQDWNHMPLILFCGVIFRFVYDPQRIEKQNDQILIYSKFFFPYDQHSLIIHFTEALELKKMLIFEEFKDKTKKDKYRILFGYQSSLVIEKNNQREIFLSQYPTKIEIYKVERNSIVELFFFSFNPDFKVDDVRFLPEFLSR